MDDEDIERAVALLTTASAHSEVMIQSIMDVARKGYPYDWFLENWAALSMDQQGLSLDEVQFIKPWIETWAEEAYSRLEKENDK